jgi:hypothetical protein
VAGTVRRLEVVPASKLRRTHICVTFLHCRF